MPISYSIHPDRGLVHFRMSGTIDVPQTLASFSGYVRNPLFDPSYVMLTDAQDVGAVDADFLGIVGGGVSIDAHHVLDALPTRPDPRNQLDKSRRQARRGEPPKEHPWWWD
mgnify:CR=1 FL=1